MPGTSSLQGPGTARTETLRDPLLPVLPRDSLANTTSPNFLTSVWNFLLISRFLQGSRKWAYVVCFATVTMVQFSFILASFPFTTEQGLSMTYPLREVSGAEVGQQK